MRNSFNLLLLPCLPLLVRACPRMSVGYAEVFPIRGYYPTKMGQASAYRTTLLGEWGEPDRPSPSKFIKQ